jgi:hypothetical protein
LGERRRDLFLLVVGVVGLVGRERWRRLRGSGSSLRMVLIRVAEWLSGRCTGHGRNPVEIEWTNLACREYVM